MSSFHDSLGVNQSGHVIAEKPQIKDGRKLKLKQTYVEGIFLLNWWLHFPLSEKKLPIVMIEKKVVLLCKVRYWLSSNVAFIANNENISWMMLTN